MQRNVAVFCLACAGSRNIDRCTFSFVGEVGPVRVHLEERMPCGPWAAERIF